MNNITNRRSSRKSKRNKSADLKVVYISSPMKVKTCASNFCSTVQQLTGRDSDLVDRLMDEYANNNLNITNEVLLFDDEKGWPRKEVEIPETKADHGISNNSYESPTSSGSMPFEEAAGGLMFSDVLGGGGLDEGFSFDEIFGAAGFLLECPLDEASQFYQ